MFMLRMIGSNSGDFVCTQVLHNLWKLFLFKKFVVKNDRPSKKEKTNSSIETSSYSSDDYEEPKEEIKPKTKNNHSKMKTRLQQNKKKNPFFHKLFKETPSTSKRILENRSFKTKKKPITVFSSLHLGKENVVNATMTPNIKRFQSINNKTNCLS